MFYEEKYDIYILKMIFVQYKCITFTQFKTHRSSVMHVGIYDFLSFERHFF